MNPTELLKEFFRKASTWVVPDNKITVKNGTSLLLLQLPSGDSLVLDSDAQRELGRVVTGLYQHFSKPRDEIISERTIEQVVTDTLVAAVDNSRKTEGSLDGLIQGTVAKVKEKLLSNPVSYVCWIPVAGINQYDLPASFAGCRFALFDQQLTDRITSLWADIIGSPMNKDLVSLLLQDPRVRRSCQMIEVPVKALDEHTAFELAEKRARQVIDTLNFFADLIPFNHSRVYLVPWDCTEPRASFSLSEKGDWSVSSEVPGQSIGYDMGFLRLSSYLSDAIARAEELLVHADTLDSFSSVLLSSLLWAGRATTEQNLEEAFLLYAIALETLMLPEGTQHELRFRLALRVACF